MLDYHATEFFLSIIEVFIYWYNIQIFEKVNQSKHYNYFVRTKDAENCKPRQTVQHIVLVAVVIMLPFL